MGKPVRLADTPDNADEPESVAEQWVSAQEVSRTSTRWLWPQIAVANALTIVEGDKGVGKTTLLASVVAAVTAGTKLLGRRKQPHAAAIWLAGEVPYDSFVRPRLQAAGADMALVKFPSLDARGIRRKIVIPQQLTALERSIREYGAKLVVVDPLASFADPTADLRSDQSTHAVLDPLIELAAATDCSFFLSRHLSKDRSAPRICQGLGGAAVGGAAQSVLAIDWPDRRTARRLLRVVACNAAEKLHCIEYSLRDAQGVPIMAGTRFLSEEEDEEEGAQLDVGERDVRADARRLLRLLIGNEWVTVRSIVQEATSASISERTLRTAKAELGVRTRPNRRAVPPCWEWGPPSKGWKEGG